ncbi:MAG: hypothetical protein PXY39_09045 [archaeon]|nr:hypothetical protein [archaeon]
MARLRPGLSRETINSLILQKKSKVGGGFLTDQGALFLVASDLGVTLKPMVSDATKPYDPRRDASDLVVEARILTIGTPKLIQRMQDSSPTFVLKMVLYDVSTTMSMNIWNHALASALIQENFRPGDAIKVRGAYRRKGVDSSGLELSVSDRGEIVKADENHSVVSQIPRISDRIIHLSQLITVPQANNVVVRAGISSAVRTGEFKRKEGTHGRYVSFSLRDKDEDDQEKISEIRVVIWDNSNPVFEKLRIGELITLLNVKPKITEYLGKKTLELHGDETTDILEHWDESKIWLEGRFGLVSQQIRKFGTPLNEDVKLQKTSAFIARILSIEQKLEEEKTSSPSHVLLIDSLKRRIAVTVQDEALQDTASLKIDDVIICKPYSFDQIGLKAVCSETGSLSRVKPVRSDIPRSTVLVSEIAKLEANSLATIDCMVLSISPSRDIQTKEGAVKRSEALLADPSGEIKLYAWRSLSKHLEKLSAGDRLWLYACEVQSHEGKKFLVFKNYSRIEIQR